MKSYDCTTVTPTSDRVKSYDCTTVTPTSENEILRLYHGDTHF